jgi:hypothetical protein
VPSLRHSGQIEPWLDEAIDTVVSPTRSTEARSELISVLNEGGQDDKPIDAQIDKRVPMFMRLKRLLPKDRSERISVASLLVAMASLANDIYTEVTDDSVTVTELERVLKARGRRRDTGILKDMRLFETYPGGQSRFSNVSNGNVADLIGEDRRTIWKRASPIKPWLSLVLWVRFARPVRLIAVRFKGLPPAPDYQLWTSRSDEATPSDEFLGRYLDRRRTQTFLVRTPRSPTAR